MSCNQSTLPVLQMDRLQRSKQDLMDPGSLEGSGIIDFGEGLLTKAGDHSMKEAGIRSGDHLIFIKDREPDNGDIVLLEIYGQFMCRRIFFEPAPGKMSGRIRIRREDGAVPDLVTDDRDARIMGVFYGLFRDNKRKKSTCFLLPYEAEQAEKKKKEKELSAGPSPYPYQGRKQDPSMRVLAMGLPSRLANRLTEIGIRTAGDLLDIPDREAFLAIPGIGKKSYDQTLAALRVYGFDVRHLTW